MASYDGSCCSNCVNIYLFDDSLKRDLRTLIAGVGLGTVMMMILKFA